MAEQDELQLEGGDPKTVEIPESELQEMKDQLATLNTQLRTAEIDKARLEVKAEAPAPAATEAPPRLTREKLQEAVDAGQITQVNMDTELARQMREDVTAEVSTGLRAEFQAEQQERAFGEQYEGYLEMKPGINVEGSDDRARVQVEYQALVKLGQPGTKGTELLAMRNIFGSLDRVEETTRQRRETHEEAGGGSRSPEGGSAGSDWEKGLTGDQVAIYRHQLEKGLYPSETDAKFLRITTRARTGNVDKRKSA